MISTFLRPKPCKMMRMLRDSMTQWHLSKLARGSGATYVYVSRFMASLQAGGIVTIEAKGKKKIVKLTEKGARIAGSIEELAKDLEGSDDAK